jgi:hypothetical protein
MLVALASALLVVETLAFGTGDYGFVLSYHPTAKRERKPTEPFWAGEPPCGNTASPSPGPGAKKFVQPKLLKQASADLSKLTAKTRAFVPFLAEVTISAEGRVSAVRILRSSSAEFDAVVLRQLGSQVYEPARLDERAVATCMVYTARPHP